MKIPHQTQKGFSLIEVLVALMISSVGILGMASMQLGSLKSTSHSFFRSQASLFSYEIIDYMRANRNAAVNQDYDIALKALSEVTDPGQSGSIADKERYRWFSKIDTVLPNSKASIDCDNTAACQIQISWSNLANQGTSTVTVAAQL